MKRTSEAGRRAGGNSTTALTAQGDIHLRRLGMVPSGETLRSWEQVRMGITSFQWIMLVLGVLGFLLTWTLTFFGAGRVVEAIKQDTTEKVAAASKALTAKIEALREEFIAEQKAQDHNFGEVGLAMREYTSRVEKEMHEIEIWGRDNFVLKDAFERVTDRIEEAIKGMAAEIKSDFRDLNAKIDGKH